MDGCDGTRAVDCGRRRHSQGADGLLDRQTGCSIIPKSFMGAAETRELLPGTLDMLILKVLSRGEMHGYGIVSAIQRASDDVLCSGTSPAAQRPRSARGSATMRTGYSSGRSHFSARRPTASGRRRAMVPSTSANVA